MLFFSENLTLAIWSPYGIPCRHGNTAGMITRGVGTDPTRSASLYAGTRSVWSQCQTDEARQHARSAVMLRHPGFLDVASDPNRRGAQSTSSPGRCEQVSTPQGRTAPWRLGDPILPSIRHHAWR